MGRIGRGGGDPNRHAGADLPAHRTARGGARLSRRRSPDRVPGLVDSHCHLQEPAFSDDLDDVLARAAAAGIERILVPGYDLASSRAALELAASRPGMLLPAVGVHPHHAARTDEPGWAELERLVREPAVVAVGEIGLDFFRNLSPQRVQRDAFERQLALAAGCGLPVLVHDRDAHEAVLAALLGWQGGTAGRPRGVLHAFSGDAAMAHRAIAAGFLVSFALPVAFRTATGPREAAASVPVGSFLVETDAPWLAPGGGAARNEPTTVLRVAAELGRLRQEPIESVARDVRIAFDRLVA